MNDPPVPLAFEVHAVTEFPGDVAPTVADAPLFTLANATKSQPEVVFW
jgi:hypothetical protein